MGGGEHEVAAYDDAAALVHRVARFVAESLADGLPVVMASRPAHHRAIVATLTAMGADPVRAGLDGDLVILDADETLALFMVDGHPEAHRFAELVASVLPAGGGPVSVFGEMVAVLWERGDMVAALELESLWNTVLAAHPIRLLCAYPGELLAGAGLEDVSQMCDLHDHVSLIGAHPRAGEMPTGTDEARSSVHLPVPAAVASVRHFVRDALTGWGLHDLVGDAALITSELATNAITHGSSPFRTSLARTDGLVRVSVEDGSREWPRRHEAQPGDQDGRGMAIVATLSQRSGCDPTPHGKVAWAELSV